MTADMKTLRAAVTILEDLTDEVPLEAKQEHPLWPSECVANLTSALDELEALRALAEKVNNIRNSIVGAHTFNWSEHAYPLVAALEEAGIKGAGYPASRANVGTLIERAIKAETQRDELLAALEGLTKAFDARAVRGGVDWESNPAANVGAAFRAALDAIANARGGA